VARFRGHLESFTSPWATCNYCSGSRPNDSPKPE
jgi:hypothetical protein